MSLSDLASLGSFVSGFAVLISLIFLYFQLRQLSEQGRQSERNQKALIQSGRAARITDLILRRADHAVAYRKAMHCEDMTAEELTQYRLLCIAALFDWEDSFFQHQEHSLDDKPFASMVAGIKASMTNPAMRAFWKMNREYCEESFRSFVDEIVHKAKPRLPPDDLEFRRALAAELAAAV
jgi:hypothetical protein